MQKGEGDKRENGWRGRRTAEKKRVGKMRKASILLSEIRREREAKKSLEKIKYRKTHAVDRWRRHGFTPIIETRVLRMALCCSVGMFQTNKR